MAVRTTKRSVMAMAIAATACMALAACGGSSDPAGSGSGGGSGAVPAEATKLVDENLANPTTVGYDTPLSATPPKGKKIVALQVAVDVAKVENEAMAKAAAALGWNFEKIVIGTGPEGPAKAFDAAIDKKPDGIYYSGQPSASLAPQLARAKAAGIAVFAEALGEATPDAAFAQIRNTPTVERLADITAAWVVSDSKASGDILIVDTPAFRILHSYSARVEKTIKRLCPGCKVSVMDANVTDIGTALPGQIVSQLQRSPKTNYLVFSFGDLTAGVNPALSAAGLQGKVKVTGQLPGLANIKNLSSGEDAMWVPELSPLIGWRVIDAFAREFVGDDPNVAGDGSPTPTQILTKSNVEGAVFDSSGYWVGVADYEAKFKKMWNVG